MTMSKNNSGSANSKKGKSLPKPAVSVNPASVDLFPTQDEILAEAVTLPNSSVSDVEDVGDDDSVKDADFVPGKGREAEEETDDDDVDEGDDEEEEDIGDLNKSPLVKKVTKSVKSAMKAVPELHPADLKPNEGAIWNYFSKRIQRDTNDALIEKTAICKVINTAVGRGVPCGTTLKQPGSSTTGPRNHLKRKHPKQWAELLAIEHAKLQVKRGVRSVLHDTMDKLEGEYTLNLSYLSLYETYRIFIRTSM